MEQFKAINDIKIGLEVQERLGTISDFNKQLLTELDQALQLQQTGVSGSIYGYALEIIAKDYKGSWFKHYNHKLYETEDSAKNAIEQMKDFIFYSDFEWRIVPIYCH